MTTGPLSWRPARSRPDRQSAGKHPENPELGLLKPGPAVNPPPELLVEVPQCASPGPTGPERAGRAGPAGWDSTTIRCAARRTRLEAAIRLATMILLVVVVPLACIIVGQFAAHLAERQVHSQQAANVR